MPVLTPSHLLFALVSILVYEALRSLIVGGVKRWLSGGALRFVRRNRVQLDSARFIDRLWLRERLLRDGAVDAALLESAAARGVPEAELREKVNAWVAEIVPAFSLAAYYRFGAVVARAAVDFCFELVFQTRDFEASQRKVPPGAVIVYVMNHRSNADYVVLSVGLLRHVALSYAVGEWARVWPLDVLFRSFGSFFVRRGEQDRLYHKVLERYVQILLAQGGVTGFFIEGRLSRDGALCARNAVVPVRGGRRGGQAAVRCRRGGDGARGAPKAGLLDAIVGLRREFPAREIAFLPIGLNFDHVLEDRSLVRERSNARPPGFLEKLASLAWFLARVPWLLGARAARLALRGHRKFGTAAVAAGDPVLLSAWEETARLPDGQALPEGGLAALSFEARRPMIKALATDLLASVGKSVPATPVPILCAALLEDPDAGVSAITGRVRALVTRLRAAGAPVALGAAFAAPKEMESSELGHMEAEVSALEEAERIVTLAGYNLERRGLVQHVEGCLVIVAENVDLIQYYARSLAQHTPSTVIVTQR